MDVFTPEKRSQIMSRVRGKGNAETELRLIALMRGRGLRGWRRGSKLPGRPDFVFARARLAVFVDGCFWHGCPKHGRIPSSNSDYWRGKIARNAARDRAVTRTLKALGWRVMRIWAHSLGGKLSARTLARLAANLGADAPAAPVGASAPAAKKHGKRGTGAAGRAPRGAA